MIKVDIVSGFLGAGKTTFIKKILELYKDKKVVLIENEFGEVGIDGDLIKKDGFEVIELQSGCICCSIKTNFIDSINKIIKDINPEYIIVEPTGIGLLSDIIGIFKNEDLNKICSINSLITVVDSMNYIDMIEDLGYFFEDQIINASTLILSKSQFLEEKEVEAIIKSLKKLNKNAYILNKNWDNLSIEDVKNILNNDDLSDLDELYHFENYSEMMKDMTSVSIKVHKKYSKEEISEILDKLNKIEYGIVLRGKGYLNSDEGNIEFNYVNGNFTVQKSEVKSDGKLCIIGKNLDKNEINNLFS
ncbi:CobW family GTP-binding protein [Tepidibacter hydrothermalis]|uniref:GTP-binding protein n=1 Tax=Tepidibacter hydrothermalis TaxID=3036126 RepID=A0ABY8EGX7_9FIRM|nr:GTP-binding protein [Tepidibacter hydrothermalis]WFD11110.1 GTP-binding protein [Tepidibacter hydrothermalis]